MTTKKQRCARLADYRTYYPTRDGHVIHIDHVWQSFEPSNEECGLTSGSAACSACGGLAHVVMANGYEYDGDNPARPRMPENARHWDRLNRTGGVT
jgi:hypothetical protein